MKQTAKSTFILLVMAGSTAFAQNQPTRQTAKEVQLGCDSPIINSYQLISTITTAIQKDKSSPSFRVTWGGRLGGGSNDGTCLYNREKGILRYYDLTGYIYDVGWRPQRRMYCIFTEVTDEKLLKVVHFSTAAKTQVHVLPNLLLRVGCHKRVDKIKTFKAPAK